MWCFDLLIWNGIFILQGFLKEWVLSSPRWWWWWWWCKHSRWRWSRSRWSSSNLGQAAPNQIEKAAAPFSLLFWLTFSFAASADHQNYQCDEYDWSSDYQCDQNDQQEELPLFCFKTFFPYNFQPAFCSIELKCVVCLV